MGKEWKVLSRRSLLRRIPWFEVEEVAVSLPDGRRIRDFYTSQLRTRLLSSPSTTTETSLPSAITATAPSPSPGAFRPDTWIGEEAQSPQPLCWLR